MDSVRFTLSYIFRIILYAGIMFLLNALYMYDAQNITSTGKFGEISATEIAQEVFLFLSGLMFIFVARRNKDLRVIAWLAALFFFMSFIREFNNFVDFWFYLVLPLALAFVWIFFRNFKYFFPSMAKLLEMPATAYLVIGFLVTFVFSRLFGRTKFWEALLESDYNRWAKSAAEEGIELLGYALLFIGSLEIFISVVKRSRKISERTVFLE